MTPLPTTDSPPSQRGTWIDALDDDLESRRDQGLLRRLITSESSGPITRRAERQLVNLGSNDYLGLSGHPKLKAAAVDAIERYGVGVGASRLAGGNLLIHEKVEARFAAFKHAEAALLFPTGYTANLAVLTTLAGPGDTIFLDKLNHASLIDAALASGATVRVFPHLDYAKLEKMLGRLKARGKRQKQEKSRRQNPRSLVSPSKLFFVTDSVFSMDGDTADLPQLCNLADRHGAIVVVDEAHGTGVLGKHGGGLCETQGVADRVDIAISTASKAMGGLGGLVTARSTVIQTLVNRARPFIYTTAVPPAQAAAIGAALDVIENEPWRRHRLKELATSVGHAVARLTRLNRPRRLPKSKPLPSIATPIIPLVVGGSEQALDLSAHLEKHGFFAPAIRPPTVARGSSRVRLSLRADLTDEQIARLIAALHTWKPGL